MQSEWAVIGRGAVTRRAGHAPNRDRTPNHFSRTEFNYRVEEGGKRKKGGKKRENLCAVAVD